MENNWTLDSLLQAWAGASLPALPVSGVSLDSRLVEAGDVYLAVGGATTHGIEFADAAMAAGAVAVLLAPDALVSHSGTVELLRIKGVPVFAIAELESVCGAIAARFYGEPDQSMTLLAVTGTDGKTSVCRFIAQALQAAGYSCGYIGTLGWGLGEQLQNTALTTPDEVTLRRMLASMRDQGAQYIALEASSHGLAEGRLAGLSLDVAVLTNLGRDHLDYHHTLEAYREAKEQLFHWPGLSAAVVNGCDQFGQDLLDVTDSLNRYVYCSHEPLQQAAEQVVTIRASDIKTDDQGLSCVIHEGDESGTVSTTLMGRFNVDNLLACYGSLRALGVAANQARHCVSLAKPVPGRMERFTHTGMPTVLVDFSHTPQALSVAISAVQVHCRGQLWLVFGCGGDRDPGKRAPMAKAAEAANHVVLTDDNPRTEQSADIIADVMQGFTAPSRVTVIADRAAAIRHAILNAAQDDLVLIAGKGHEDYQIVGDTRIHFSDAEQVLAVLEQAS